MPLRGEFTLPSSGNTDHSPSNGPIPETAESLPNILHQISRLSAPPPVLPTIQLTIPNTPTSGPLLGRSTSLSRLAKDVTSPWSNTVSETASTEAALLPFLVHLAVVRDDADALRFCFDTSSAVDATPIGEPAHPIFAGGGVEIPQIFNMSLSGRGVTGGIVNVLDPASGRTPLHVAALNGSSKCAMLLLENGALVHLRDSLDHTALYYVSGQFRALSQLTQVRWVQAARQGHESIVSHLVQAGAHLGGSDFAFMRVAVRKALHLGDHATLGVWRQVGVEFNEAVSPIDPSTSP